MGKMLSVMSISIDSLAFKNVSVAVGEQVILKELTLTLDAGKIYTILGPSGTGKSTLLRVVAGLQNIAAGEIELAGQPYKASHHLIGLVPQNYGLLPWQTAWQAVTMAVKISQKKKRLSSDDLAEIDRLFSAMEISELKQAYPNQMSGGQQQRVSITRAFAIKGDFLLMDEPFSSLDAFTREKAQSLFRETWQRDPKTTLFITHDIEEALLLGQKIILMTGQPGQILTVVDNPLGCEGELVERREHPDFYLAVQTLRRELASR
ncbi:ABC transporter ATP-binding protein [Vagococcus sp. BWB3-3]|uniref:ABC transporter ATP-binding protein n=1 Tax=Vagococcus allomyrinae TaxID=2794353 RepID=A0A940P1T4_9ENTE|nr:ABC transporter ATP-binding protein [Vagococcus allomyrinae]MBP1039907.1 ABC transporter ATP-binding protein [Vagococcus allomyrinae]